MPRWLNIRGVGASFTGVVVDAFLCSPFTQTTVMIGASHIIYATNDTSKEQARSQINKLDAARANDVGNNYTATLILILNSTLLCRKFGLFEVF